MGFGQDFTDLNAGQDDIKIKFADNTILGNALDAAKVVLKDAAGNDFGTATNPINVDKQGATVLYTGSVGTTAIAIPTTADKEIDEIGIRCAVDQTNNRRLEFSFDNVTFHRLLVGEAREEEPRGAIKQVYIRAAGNGVTTVNYEIAINYGLI